MGVKYYWSSTDVAIALGMIFSIEHSKENKKILALQKVDPKVLHCTSIDTLLSMVHLTPFL